MHLFFCQVLKKNWLQPTTVFQNPHHLSADEILIFFHGSTKATEKNVSWFPFKLLLTESRFKSKSECTSSLSLSEYTSLELRQGKLIIKH